MADKKKQYDFSGFDEVMSEAPEVTQEATPDKQYDFSGFDEAMAETPESTPSDEAVTEAPIVTNQPVPTVDGPSQLEALGLGTASGVTLDFADEIGGGIAAIGAQLGGSEETIPESYRKYRDVIRDRMAKARDAHEGTFLAGEIGSAFIPGLGAIGALGKAAKGAGALAKFKQTLKAGAGVGGITGLGKSEADLTKGEFGEAAGDVALGVGIGGVFSGGLSALGVGAKALRKSNLGRSVELGMDDIIIFGDIARDYFKGQMRGVTNLATRKLIRDLNRETQKKAAALAKNKGKIDQSEIQDAYTKAEELIDASYAFKSPAERANFKKTLFRNLHEAEPEIIKGGIVKKRTTIKYPQSKKVQREVKEDIRKSKEPGFKIVPKETKITAKKTYERKKVIENRRTIQETGDLVKDGVLKGNLTAEQGEKIARAVEKDWQKMSDISEQKPILGAIQRLFKNIVERHEPGVKIPNEKINTIMELFKTARLPKKDVYKLVEGGESKKAVQYIQKLANDWNPADDVARSEIGEMVVKLYGPKAGAKIQKRLDTLARDFSLAQSIGTKGEALTLPGRITGLSVGNIINAVANSAGLLLRHTGGAALAKTVKGTGGAVVSGAQKLVSTLKDSTKLTALSNKLKQENSEVSQAVAKQIDRIGTTDSQRLKNALIFSLMQNPDHRHILAGIEDQEDETKDDEDTNPATERPDEIAK